jgi:hypothetical protein
MSRWAICSSLVLLATSSGWAQERLTQDEALRLAFPGAAIERRTAYLEDRQVDSVRQLAGSEVSFNQRVITYYVGVVRGVAMGAAYFDGHVVRTRNEVVMVVVDPLGRIRQVEVLRFDEPPEYRPPDRWIAQFEGHALTPRFSLKSGILNLTGASLTSRALVGATRRVLALHQVIHPFQADQ